jgi:hypothetical protein
MLLLPTKIAVLTNKGTDLRMNMRFYQEEMVVV